MAHGKKYLEAAKLVDRERLYPPEEAAQLVKETTTVDFDASIEAHLRLGVDPRHADQMVRGTVVLPHGTGKVVRVVVFAQGEKAAGGAPRRRRRGGWRGPRQDGSRPAGSSSTSPSPTPDTMGLVGRLGKILGRRGLMPNPKAGTITFDLDRAVREVKGGRVEFKVDKAGIIHSRGRQEQLRGGRDRRQPRGARRRDQPGPARRGQGPVPQDPDDRQHDGPRHPGRRAGGARGRSRVD